jgi:hypothetical protein
MVLRKELMSPQLGGQGLARHRNRSTAALTLPGQRRRASSTSCRSKRSKLGYRSAGIGVAPPGEMQNFPSNQSIDREEKALQG